MISQVGIKYRFGVLNRFSGEYEMGSSDLKSNVQLEVTKELRSIGYKNIAISDKHINANGDIKLVVKMKLDKDDSDNHCLTSDLGKLLNDEKTSDLVLQTEGKTFHVHKNILSARSNFFDNLLKEQMENIDRNDAKSSNIEMDIKAEVLNEILTYIYTDTTLKVDTMSKPLLAASDKYKLPGLKRQCEKHLCEMLNPNNVAAVLLLADQHQCRHLKKSALRFCKDNYAYIMKDDDWKMIEKEKPDLFTEAISEVLKMQECNGSHTECIKKSGKRFQFEKNSSVVDVNYEF